MRMLIILLMCAVVFPGWGQTLQGIVDIHAHSHPDSTPRSIDALDLAKLAKENGYRGVLLKNHFMPTAQMAYLLNRLYPQVAFRGGVVLNRPLGGINPAAVERLAAMEGGAGKVVWMPTFDSENQVKKDRENRPFVPVSKNGKLLPEVLGVLDAIAKHDLVLATGHSTPKEVLALIEEGRKRGVKRIVVTHPMQHPVRMSEAEIRRAAELGAYLEFAYLGFYNPKEGHTIGDYAKAIRAAGTDRAILSSDLGQAGNPYHPEGMKAYFRLLGEHGYSEAEIEQMAKGNPARLLGLE